MNPDFLTLVSFCVPSGSWVTRDLFGRNMQCVCHKHTLLRTAEGMLESLLWLKELDHTNVILSSPSERKTLTTSSNGSVNELTSVDTDVYRSSVVMPMLMWVSLVFHVWLPQMFAQHPLQSEDTTQHVKIIKGMYSDILLNVISWLCGTLFFLEHTNFLWRHRKHSH